jgi:DNA-binding NtrC family response regulator
MNNSEIKISEIKLAEIKLEEVPVEGKSAWNVAQPSAPAAAPSRNSASRNLVEWPAGGLPYTLRSMRAHAEIYAITRALEVAGWNRKRAAKLLRISYRGLLYKISSHKITRSTKADSLLPEATAAFASEQIK